MSDVGIEPVSRFGRFGKCVSMRASASSVADDSDEIAIGKSDWIAGCGPTNGAIAPPAMLARSDIRSMPRTTRLRRSMLRCANALPCTRPVYVMPSSAPAAPSAGTTDGFCSSACSDSSPRLA